MQSEKIVLVTGASRGIGAATALLFAQNGYAVGINYKSNEAAARQVQESIEQTGSKCCLLQADVAVESEVLSMFDLLDSTLGSPSVLVNNAGILFTQSRLEDMDVARFSTVLTQNVTSVFLCSREAVKRMSTRHGGHGGAIVNVSSGAARSGSPNEYVDYAASKGAVDTLTRGLALEVAAEGIRVNCVRPGLIYTDIHAAGGEPGRVDRLKNRIPMQRGGKPEEVAEAIYWLASAKASFATGCFLDLAGGL